MPIDQPAITRVRQKLTELESVPVSLVREVILKSTWWIGHPQGRHPEPGWADRIERGPLGWEVKFGANYFCVEKAILFCKVVITEELEQAMTLGEKIDRRSLRGMLNGCIRRAVANFRHELYNVYPRKSALPGPLPVLGSGGTRRYVDDVGDFMPFGVHAIKVDDAMKEIWKYARLDDVSCENANASGTVSADA